MTPAEFTEYWNKSDKPSLNKFRLTSPLASGLSSACVSALKEYGLPDAAGWLEFGETNDFSKSVTDALDARNLFPIGRVGASGFICIDKSSGAVVIYDQDDPDELWLMNSSLEQLYESIMICDVFNSGINAQNPDYHRNYKIPDRMLNGLKNKLTECDPVAMAGKSYWCCEVSALDDSFATHLTAL